MEEEEPNEEPLFDVDQRKGLDAIKEEPSEGESETDSKTSTDSDSNKDKEGRKSDTCILVLSSNFVIDKSTNNLLDLDISSDDYDRLSDTEKTYALQYPEFIKSYQAVSDDSFESLLERYRVLIVYYIFYYVLLLY